MIIPEYHTDYKVSHINTKPFRAYAVPYESFQTAEKNKRENSAFFTLLNGNWSFKHYDSVQYIQDEFYAADYPLFDGTMPVPGMWQTNGVDTTAYVSSPYPFMYRPPFIPKRNQAGVYLYDFNYNKKENKKYEIVLEGVDSCLYLWLNGTFVGYSEISHNESVFDITKMLKNGKNHLSACVLKRCNGTYLEDQDKLRLTGIFRDVYILERDENHIEDAFLKQTTTKEKTVLDCEFTFDGLAEVNVSIFAPDGKLLQSGTTENGKIAFEINNPLLWSAEEPVLYTVDYSCGNEYFSKKIGFRYVEIKNGVFYLNGQNIKIKGVNRHDSHPEKGYAVSFEDIENDIKMMKEYNINAIRTSHYSNSPLFYELCDKYGIYVIAEADFETHGCAYNDVTEDGHNTGEYDSDLTFFSDNEKYENLCVERFIQNIESFKNNSSVIIWSFGNESGFGRNHKIAADYAHKRTPDRFVHLETYYNIYTEDNDIAKEHNKLLLTEKPYMDFYSNMYPKFEQMEIYLNKIDDNRPYILCEYSHAMGNSCGDISDYVDFFYNHDRCVGGCVWEWCDHAIKMKDENGKDFFGYGGDFGDKILNTSNICADGLVSPDRKPHSSLLEVKNVYAPVHITGEENKVTVENRYEFKNLSHILFVWNIFSNGKLIKSEKFTLNTNAREKEEIAFDIPDIFGESYLKIEAFDGKNRIYVYQHQLKTSGEKTTNIPAGMLEVNETDYSVTIKGNGFSYGFSKISPVITSINYGKEILKNNQSFSFWRAPLDNDRNVRASWSDKGMFKNEGNIRYAISDYDDLKIFKEKDCIKLLFQLYVGTMGRRPIVKAKTEISVFVDGLLTIKQDGNIRELRNMFLPRYGLMWEIDGNLTNMRYFGFGPYETYVDKHHGATMEIFDENVSNIMPNYVRPQESNSHYNTKWATFTDRQGRGITFISDKMSFSASMYSDDELTDKAHPNELVKSDSVFVHTDKFMSGVGSASCGPALNKKYHTPTGDFEFILGISPKTENQFELLKRI